MTAAVTLDEMKDDLRSYTTYESDEFEAALDRFILECEERIWYFIGGLPNFRKSQTGTMTSGNPYLQLPTDFLAPSSLSLTDPPVGSDAFLLNKDVEYIRQVFPSASDLGVPFCYALFDVDVSTTNIIIGPTPDSSYSVQLNYFYRPASLTVDTTGTWLSTNAYDVLLYGALSESSNWLKRAAGIDAMGDTYEQRFLVGLQGLKNLGESRDRKDTYRGGEKRKAEVA